MRRAVILFGIVLSVAFIYAQALKRRSCVPWKQLQHSWSNDSASGPGNATLGFGAIFVLAEEYENWRVQGLLEASKLGGLHLTIPRQRRHSQEEIVAYLLDDNPVEPFDDIRDVLNSIYLLELFLETGFETALIMKCDIDFSTEIKAQLVLFAQALLSGVKSEGESGDTSRERKVSIDAKMPYGEDDWDMIWLGHDGIEYTARTRTEEYADPNALSWVNLTSSFNDYYERMAYAEKASG